MLRLGPEVLGAAPRRVRMRHFAVLLGSVALVGLAVYSAHSAKYALAGALALLCLGIGARQPVALAALAVVGTLVIVRIGGASTNLSVSDALLFVGTIAALALFKASEDRDAVALLGLVAGYEALLIVAVLYHPYRADFTEWVHEAFLAGGSVVVGWVVGRRGVGPSVLRALLAGIAGFALWAVAFTVTHHFQAANLPFGYQKNFVGDLEALGVLIAYANPVYLRLSAGSRRWLIALGLLGLAASQSRQAVVALTVAMLVVVFRGRVAGRTHARAALWLAVPALAYIGWKVQQQVVSSNRFNSIHQRFTWYHSSLTLFHLSPWLGEGLRWWYTGRFAFAFQPPNAELEMLTSAGLLGLFAFVYLELGALRRVWRVPPEYGTLAFAVLLMRLVDGQFDIFWVTAQAALPWMIVGIALGARVLSQKSRVAPPAAALAAASLG